MTSKLIVLLITAIALSGCTSMRHIDGQRTRLDEAAKPGDHVVIYEKSGRIVDMTYSHSDGDLVKGALINDGNRPVTVSMDDVQRIEIEKIDGAKTTLAVVGGTIAVVPLLFIVGLTGGAFMM